MADSNITKKALAAALKQLLEEKPFEKINIGDICERCDMNRKSFYYHFKDKYDLVNWIFDTEFVNVVRDRVYKDAWDAMLVMSQCFYNNRNFYRKALCITGQNSFSEHLQNLLSPVIMNKLKNVLNGEEDVEFQVTFIADAIVMAFQRWIVDNGAMTPENFVEQIRLSIKFLSIVYGDSYDKN